MSRLDLVTTGKRPPGVYRWLSRAHPSSLARELTAEGWQLSSMDGSILSDASALFDACAEIFAFPAYFGRNWDALHDCLADLSWLDDVGRVVLWERFGVFADRDPDSARMALSVFGDAASERASTGASPLYVLLRGDGDTVPLL